MKYVSVFYVIVSLFAVCVFSAPAFSSDEITPDEVLRIAEKEKGRLFSMIAFAYTARYGNHDKPKYDYPNYGSPINVQELLEAKVRDAQGKIAPIIQNDGKKNAIGLDQPFRIYTIGGNDILQYQNGDDLSLILIPTNEWIVPMDIDGKANCCINVCFKDGKWQAVGISMGDFGGDIKTNVPPEAMPGKGGKYVRIKGFQTDFVAVEDQGETKIMPMTHSMQSFSSAEKQRDSKGRYRASDIIPKIAETLRAATKAEF